MKRKTTYQRIVTLTVTLFSAAALVTCGGPDHDRASQSNIIRLALSSNDNSSANKEKEGAASDGFDCEKEGVSDIHAYLFSPDRLEARAEGWNCAKRRGLLYNIPSGTDFALAIIGTPKSNQEEKRQKIVVYGEKFGINIPHPINDVIHVSLGKSTREHMIVKEIRHVGVTPKKGYPENAQEVDPQGADHKYSFNLNSTVEKNPLVANLALYAWDLDGNEVEVRLNNTLLKNVSYSCDDKDPSCSTKEDEYGIRWTGYYFLVFRDLLNPLGEENVFQITAIRKGARSEDFLFKEARLIIFESQER